MKLSDYRAEQLKNEVKEVLDFNHDTAYGGFYKGMQYEKESWIAEKMPEDFEDLMHVYGTKRVLCICITRPGENLKHMILIRVQTPAKLWNWVCPDNDKLEMSEIDVMDWKPLE